MPPRTSRTRTPRGWNLFGEPYYSEPGTGPHRPSLPVFTPDTLPDRYLTRKQVEELGLTPGPPVGVLRWTPRGRTVPEECRVYDRGTAQPTPPREPDLFDAVKEEQRRPRGRRGGSGA
ncbi:hypothetical protein [Streptomyces sp. S.PNR 29]|uniref:hypothetical protein n=1 Tax=Streptomyces sp. S.PNR 29 TaxID=2973805 RepID=UPI0025B17D1C|nr:hypothetical protein [Streptomyces sp. S.PNR 29]MDN0194571.1 hypothetical protein [Streptomyces sp. S.PNR 29]